jgi:type I site-specific restriction endonuclease
VIQYKTKEPLTNRQKAMNESETRAELIDPQLTKAGWGVVEAKKHIGTGCPQE